MHRYQLIKLAGDGTYGSVWKALNTQNHEIVAIKKMKKKYYSWHECTSLLEMKSLQRLNHPNIVRLKKVFRENDELFFVFEYMEYKLYQLMKECMAPPSESKMRNWCLQIFQALDYMHNSGYFHRDMKPENLLVVGDKIKIADFGLAREVHSKTPYTDYVSTRWYRAPEVLLQARHCGPAIGMEHTYPWVMDGDHASQGAEEEPSTELSIGRVPATRSYPVASGMHHCAFIGKFPIANGDPIQPGSALNGPGMPSHARPRALLPATIPLKASLPAACTTNRQRVQAALAIGSSSIATFSTLQPSVQPSFLMGHYMIPSVNCVGASMNN